MVCPKPGHMKEAALMAKHGGMRRRLIVGVAATVGVLGLTPTAALAIHNDEGHADKFSVGECYRFTDRDKEFCQANKELFKELRKS